MPKRPARTNGRRATIIDMSDPVMLKSITDALGGDGWATTTDIARECGFSGNGKKGQTPAVKVSSRLVAMRDRGGLVESKPPDTTSPYRDPGDRDTLWRPTDRGEQILEARLSRAVSSAVERMDMGGRVGMMGMIGERGVLQGDDSEFFALRRVLQHYQGRRQLGR